MDTSAPLPFNWMAAMARAFRLGEEAAAGDHADYFDTGEPPEDLSVRQWREIGIALGDGVYHPALDDIDALAVGRLLSCFHQGFVKE